MNNNSFNLTTEPWIKVIEMQTNQERTVSLIDIFENAQEYRQLAGEMRTQDLAIFRLLLAILTTVYSRFNADDKRYPWVNMDASSMSFKIDKGKFNRKSSRQQLLATWEKLYQSGHFSGAVIQYLKQYESRFDFFGQRPFYQIVAKDYDVLVDDEKKKIATGNGQVAVQQINRRVSESANSRAIFSPRSPDMKNKIQLDELIRWIISYQNFTGTTDKTAIKVDNQTSKLRAGGVYNLGGWLYGIRPVFAKGHSLFETLLLNLVLVTTQNGSNKYNIQKPVWEYDSVLDYIKERKKRIRPDNLAELYTEWSRILCIQWDEDKQPSIFSAKIPIFEAANLFIEPMTTWKVSPKTSDYLPDRQKLSSLGIAMWRNFGQYVKIWQKDSQPEPGIVAWLRILKREKLISKDDAIVLNSISLIKDKTSASQLPVAEVVDDMQLQVAVLFAEEDTTRRYWLVRIEDVIQMTQTIGKYYFHFIENIGRIRRVSNPKAFGNQMSGKFYEQLNEPFKKWLAGLTDQDDRDEKVNLWKRQLKEIVAEATNDVMNTSTSKDIRGIMIDRKDKGKVVGKKEINIFTEKNQLMVSVNRRLKKE
ncbi:type I-E CRISPR-associated protein Cse1/CasA [Lactiplantibacillus daowaiensis]|uniref:Type I-E CRISPR-associated protein Cse1/CasA n=1 Tax=Lactiplantibacillus daowaiensis TaxID=2559918 RepID=A0ABW1RYX8_9LACO